MSRNYQKEAAWEKEKYKHLHIKLTHDEYAKLQAILERTGQTVTTWIKSHIEKDADGE